jgi:poly(A) polymerase
VKIEFEKNFISPSALFTLKRLRKKGYSAFFVGGCVRDLLLGLKPRDWDIATDANPYKVKSIFKNSYIIGKRFKLVQIHFKREKIEVSTFRRDPGPLPENMPLKEKLVIVNKRYGTQEEDSKRRDFTINSLYYDPINFNLIDYTGGLDDLKNKIIRTIGDPYERFAEDPVRMIRACALSCRLNFKIEEEAEKAIDILKNELILIPSARLREEILRILKSGFSLKTFKFLEEKKILKIIFPFPYDFNQNFENALKIFDDAFNEFSDDEYFMFLFFSLNLKKLMNLKDVNYLGKNFSFYKNYIEKLFFSKKTDKKTINNKNFYSILKFGLKLSKIYPEYKKNLLNWKTFYFINRKNLRGG